MKEERNKETEKGRDKEKLKKAAPLSRQAIAPAQQGPRRSDEGENDIVRMSTGKVRDALAGGFTLAGLCGFEGRLVFLPVEFNSDQIKICLHPFPMISI